MFHTIAQHVNNTALRDFRAHTFKKRFALLRRAENSRLLHFGALGCCEKRFNAATIKTPFGFVVVALPPLHITSTFFISMFEMTHSGEEHCHALLICFLDRIFIAD